MEDYNNIYERIKHSSVRHYLMVRWPVNLTAQTFVFLALHLRAVVRISRSAWSILSTCCFMAKFRMQSVSYPLLKAGDMGRSQQLSLR